METISLEYSDENGEKHNLDFSASLIKGQYKKESLFVIAVDGESMQPFISDKALVVADLSQTSIENDSIYLVYQNNKMWIKKARIENNVTTFISINEKFSHLVFTKEESRVVAKAVLTFTNL